MSLGLHALGLDPLGLTSGAEGSAVVSGTTLSGVAALVAGDASGQSDAVAAGAVLNGSGSLASGGAASVTVGGFTSAVMENNTGAGLLGNTPVLWTWVQGSIGAAPTSMTHGAGMTTGAGALVVSGLPTGEGFLLVRTLDGAGVYYQSGSVG